MLNRITSFVALFALAATASTGAALADHGDLEILMCQHTEEECADLADDFYDQCVADSNGSAVAIRACRNAAADLERTCLEDEFPCPPPNFP